VNNFWLAMQFMTRIPVPVTVDFTNKAMGRSVLWYPVVGLVIGLVLWLSAAFGSVISTEFAAALVLLAWVAVTGALHLDGLADSADAWVGGQGDRGKTLSIMKDPHLGPVGASALIVTLVLKFTLVSAVLQTGQWWVLLLVPMLSRGFLLLLFLKLPYVRADGIGAGHAQYLPQPEVKWVLVLASLALGVFLGWLAVWLLLGLYGFFLLFRQMMLQRLGGMTGDTAGAAVEVSEVWLMLLILLVI